VLEVGTIVLNRFRDDLTPGDRHRLAELLKRSKGDPRKLTSRERQEVLAVVRRVDASRLSRDVTAIVGARNLRRRLRG
jgi:hypothetical protein